MKHASIVTGASRGLGLALAFALLEAGQQVVAAARTLTPELDELSARYPGQLFWLAVDLADPAAAAALMPAALAQLGAGPFASLTLINNAGVVTPIGLVGQWEDPLAVAQAVAINVTAPLLLTNAFITQTQGLAERRSVIGISSGAAVKAYPGWGVYGATKAALDHFSRHAALEQTEYANGVKVVALYPGVVDTGMQATIRGSSAEAFPNRARFEALKADGALSSPADTAARILAYLDSPAFASVPVVDIREL
ncbi:SDR family NAD(P)-dependent oxidoreductase [Crenobacter sp. SG2305]|uniref:SDR family NAD(P)-dependent oxidoreductase n=1 Tax=Crenobacter oryzisoli TaxID=3056844 RepID=UPI0025AA970D|nr:SDR family NAD(P)-dependent oxidoreductase [Crenobacter sp. SG2305]MDN0084751.1 SDR family NAD(P)-dependent oxidoreductase [Crenobacter sp. SG2305]